jgi:hypothetical protein
LFALAAVAAWLIWSAWRDREVDFLNDVLVGDDVEEVRERLLDRLVPILIAGDFTTVAHVAHTTILERRYYPGWTIAFAILFFPVGLLALLARVRETITIASSDGTLRVNGRCAKRLADWIVEDVDRVVADHPRV